MTRLEAIATATRIIEDLHKLKTIYDSREDGHDLIVNASAVIDAIKADLLEHEDWS